ncbi:hypothetical protein BMS3Abin03_01662 [bacterium BMS3Abin03]|nr:hypothetical protein BMS3Abin03_01662 [bacterium BMS3Abin03]
MILKKLNYILVLVVSLLFIAQTITIAEGNNNGKNKQGLQKIQTQVPYQFLDINNILTVFRNNGISDFDKDIANAGFVYPKGSGKTAVFASGLLWGAKVVGDPQVRVGGTSYATGLQPGRILPDGTADDPTLEKYRIYRVRPDVYPGGPDVDLSGDAILEFTTASAIRDQYELDWTEWPADLGAPYDDVDGNGIYDPTVDVPGIPGADQTLWFVGNDLNATLTGDLYGAAPMGLEVQGTFWAYNQSGALGHMYFRKYRLINKGAQQDTLASMYVSMWSDVDLGAAGDDFVGVDTTLSLQFTYNASATDAVYSPLPPPAVGFDFFQGPIVPSPGDSAIFNGKRIYDFKNLPMTAAYYFANGDPNIGDPPQGDIDGSTQYYNFFRGRFGISGQPFIDLSTGQITTFALNGDPQTRTGWLDGIQLPPGDRRQGSASGPFTLAPGDTQEVVVAEMVAGAIPGVDRLSAIGLLKFYDQIAQVAYDNFFDLPVPPPAPGVTVTELDKEIVLDWSKDYTKVQATETSDSKGYKFQGYNIYQLPSASASVSEGVRIATYDIIDGIGKIEDLVFDPTTGSVVKVPVQFGNDTGIKRFISITSDQVRGGVPLVNGIKYYYAVTSYSFNSNLDAVPNNLENPLSIITVVPQLPNPGDTYGEGTGSELEVTHVEGTADGGPTVTIVDPAATTGDEYEVFFTQQQQIRDANGNWVPGGIVLRKFGPNEVDTLTGSSIDISAVYGADGSSIQLNFHLNLVSVDGDWADGITVTFPAGVIIVDAPSFSAGNGDIIPVINGQTIEMGDVTHPYTQNGPFTGGEDWVVLVSSFEPLLPVTMDWVIFDDGWAGGPVDAVGSTTVETIGFQSRTADLWNLSDVTTNQLKLENQSVVDGIDLFPPRDDSPTNLGTDAAPVVDGFQINTSVVYGAPVDFSTLTIDGNGSYKIDSYYKYGWAATARAIDAFGAGTTDLDELQKDYEIRFTGEYDTPDTIITGTDTLIVWNIKEGTGSMATIYAARSYNLADHPMNPNPGVDEPFAIRIPFEVWSIDDNRQINILIYDRKQDPTDFSNGAINFYAFNPNDRMYCFFLNTAYHENVVDINGPEVDSLTWNTIWWKTDWVTGDKLIFQYDNPIVFGTDRFRFNSTAPSYSKDLAISQTNEINVFPNPYYGVNSEELNKYNRFVTFSHLPNKAKIRIFNLAGVLVKTIDKNDASQFQRWDLANQSGLPVASGLYIAYIEMPDLGTTKILKIAIIQEQQILDRF